MADPVRTGVEATIAEIVDSWIAADWVLGDRTLATRLADALAESGLLRDDGSGFVTISTLEEAYDQRDQFIDRAIAAESALVVERERREAAEAELAEMWNALNWAENVEAERDRLRDGIEKLCDHWGDRNGVGAAHVPIADLRSLLAGSGVSEAATKKPQCVHTGGRRNPDDCTDGCGPGWCDRDPGIIRGCFAATPKAATESED